MSSLLRKIFFDPSIIFIFCFFSIAYTTDALGQMGPPTPTAADLAEGAATGFDPTSLMVSLVASQLNGKTAQLVNGGMAVYYSYKCASSAGVSTMDCFIALTSAASAIQSGKHKDSHDKPIDAITEPNPETGYNNDSTFGNNTPPGLKDLVNSIANLPGVDPKKMEKIQFGALSKLQSMGYQVNASGNLVDASGKEYPSSALSSSSSMKAAGFGDADIAAVEQAKLAAAQIKNDIYKKYGLTNDSFEAQAAARVAAYSKAASAASGGAWNLNALLGGASVKAKKATGVGLEKNIAGGQSIGVAADNIFEMINRTYNSQKSNLSGPIALEPRAPSSYKYNP